jgi:isopenicillin-N N-acyltransferase-like protein
MNRRLFIHTTTTALLWQALRPYAMGRSARTGFTEIVASGAPYDLGMAHGKAVKAKVRHNVDFYLDLLSMGDGFAKKALLEIAGKFGPAIKRLMPDLHLEMEGIAQGSGLSMDKILLLNARTEMFIKAAQIASSTGVPGCTALVIKTKGEKGLQTALGQNWDWDPKLADSAVLLRLSPKKGPKIVTFTEAGMVGKIGFNQERLGVCLNFLSHAADAKAMGFGIPVHCMLRAIMGCTTVDQAIKLVIDSPRAASANFLIARHRDPAPTVMDLECTPGRVEELTATGEFFTHTNHFKNTGLSFGCSSGDNPDTQARDRKAAALAEWYAVEYADPVERMKRVLASDEGGPFAISKAHMPGANLATLAGVIMD